MRNKIFVPLLSVALVACVAAIARAQDPNEETVRGAFLSTRVSASAGVGSTTAGVGSTSSGRKQSGKSRSKGTGSKGSSASVGVGVGTKGTTGSKSTGSANTTGVKALASAPIGLGYSLYMRDADGTPVRIDPSRTFHAGDSIRISLETNTDGYLYVFHTENNGEPEMIYPDARLDAGDNFVEAHVPYEIPWSGEENEAQRWFVFDQNPATERLYIVLTREPLPGVPTNEQLVNYCNQGQNRCPWRPAPNLWSQVRVNAQGKVVVDKKAATYGQKQTAGEREATTRGLSLGTNAPEPSVVRMNASSSAGVLITALDLIHQ